MEPRSRHHRAAALVPLLLFITICSCAPRARAQPETYTSTVGGKEFTTYSFPRFDNSLAQLPGVLTILNNASINQNALQITPDSANDPDKFLVNQTGRVFFADAVDLWIPNSSKTNSNTSTRYVASFSTVFMVNMVRQNGPPGEGLAFLVASGRDPPPPDSFGGYLGLTNASTDGSPTNPFVAVELDTVKQFYDPDDNHIGININRINSSYVAPLTPWGIQLALNITNGTNYVVWIDYNGTSRHMWVYMAKDGEPKPAAAVLNASLDLSTILPKKAFFGFSASTGMQYQLNCVLKWNITVEALPGSAKKGLTGWKLGLAVGVPCGVVALVVGLLAGLYVMKMRRKVGDDPSSVGHNTIDLRSIPGVPREFDYKELRKGTNNFDEKMKLGKGGYGVVYRANVAVDNGQSMEVAVKQFSGANAKGQEDFLAELSIINRLRHRNLVKLVGWCHQNGVLLLVYDYMPNGSLDKHLFGGPEAPMLSWEQRYNIVAGVASALNYLHHEYDQMVIHRDIKPSNVMLDSTFNARLGDFGLARALESDKTSYTDKIGVPGTLGYIAPECFHTGRATRESDVFGFGAVVLEIVCGRRISCNNPAGCSQLLEWVWKLHGEGRVLEAVDPRLGGEFDDADADRLLLLGLACSHPNPGERPRTQAVLQILTSSVPAPAVPPSKPAFMWPALPVACVDDEVEVSSYSGMSSAHVTSSYYASSSGWTQNPASTDHAMTGKDVSTG